MSYRDETAALLIEGVVMTLFLATLLFWAAILGQP